MEPYLALCAGWNADSWPEHQARIKVRGAICWTPALAPRTPQNMLLIKCPTIAAGQASGESAF
eukprot:1160934-Pelagomonas_calceolata.AAC.5